MGGYGAWVGREDQRCLVWGGVMEEEVETDELGR